MNDTKGHCGNMNWLNDVGEDMNEMLVKEDRLFVRLNKGRMVMRSGLQLEFQKVCVSTEDGGVVLLDWLVNLDL